MAERTVKYRLQGFKYAKLHAVQTLTPVHIRAQGVRCISRLPLDPRHDVSTWFSRLTAGRREGPRHGKAKVKARSVMTRHSADNRQPNLLHGPCLTAPRSFRVDTRPKIHTRSPESLQACPENSGYRCCAFPGSSWQCSYIVAGIITLSRSPAPCRGQILNRPYATSFSDPS